MNNFGKIKNTYNSILSESLVKVDQQGKDKFKIYMNKLKNNPVLKEQFLLYDLLENKKEEDKFKTYYFVYEAIGLFKSKFPENVVLEANSMISENLNLIDDYEMNNLHESIGYLISNKKNMFNIDKIVESYDSIVNFIVNNKPKEIFEGNFDNIPNSLLGSILVDKYNEKYSDLNETNKSVLKTFLDGSDVDKKNLFENIINETIDVIDKIFENSSTDEKDYLLKAKNKLINEKLNIKLDDNLIGKIDKILELKNSLN